MKFSRTILKIPALSVFAFCSAMSCLAQDSSHVQTVTRAGVFLPSFSYEFPLGRATTLMGKTYMSVRQTLNFSSEGEASSINPGVAVSGAIRYYYNHNRRERKGKRTERNSMNFLSLVAGTNYVNRSLTSEHDPFGWQFISQLGGFWGIQRNYASGMSLDFSMGGGLYHGKEPDDADNPEFRLIIRPMIQLGLGVWLNRRAKLLP